MLIETHASDQVRAVGALEGAAAVDVLQWTEKDVLFLFFIFKKNPEWTEFPPRAAGTRTFLFVLITWMTS